jgi:hypothetical protein
MSKTKKLKCTNDYGNVDLTRQKLSKRYVHVSGKRLVPLCKKLGINHAEAVVGFDEYARQRYSAIKDGVVVSAASAPRLIAAITERDQKAAQRHQKAVDNLSVHAALFTLNRRAKRCRNLAREYYEKRMYRLAGSMRREKERVYDLKGQALHYLIEDGLLTNDGYHRFNGGACSEILTGEGYSFHRPCREPDGELLDDRSEIEAKPKGAKEPTLAAAYEVVEEYLLDKPKVPVYQWPRTTQACDWDGEDA